VNAPTVDHRLHPATGWAELAVVAWRRSWAFTGLFRRSRLEVMAASKSWTWQWAVVAWQACGQYVAQLIGAGARAEQIWLLDSASASVRRVDRRRRPPRLDGVALAVSAALATVVVVAAAEVGTLLTDTWRIAAAVLAVWLAGAGAALFRPPSEGVSRLARRARQLTPGPAVVMTEVVAGIPESGHGSRLMRALQNQWIRDGVSVAVLYAGTDDLVAFYSEVVKGWTLDADSGRRMIWTPEATR